MNSHDGMYDQKVHMHGLAVGRAVDLTVLEGYDELLAELEQMFKIEGELQHRNKWEVVFTDDEGDMMLVGDDPWLYFPSRPSHLISQCALSCCFCISG